MKIKSLSKVLSLALLAGAFTQMGLAQAPAATSNSPVAGDWKAVVQRDNGPIHVILHIAADKSGALTATIDAIEMEASDVIVSNIVLKDAKLTFDVDQAPGSYAGTLNKDATEIDGTWTGDNGAPVAMNFTRDTGTTTASSPAAAGTPGAAPASAPAAQPQN